MPYPALDPNRYGVGSPIDITDQSKLWGGTSKTNGFLMRSVDGRIPALEESFARCVIGATSPMFDSMVVPWGNALWVDMSTVDTEPHVIQSVKPADAFFVGVLKFEQGVQTGNPIQPYGLPPFTRGTVIRKGYVGYKTSMPAVGIETDYTGYLLGDETKDVDTARSTYGEWMDILKAGADGDRLGLFFGNDSGFPIVSLVLAANIASPTLANATFGGFAEIFEPENEAIYFDVRRV